MIASRAFRASCLTAAVAFTFWGCVGAPKRPGPMPSAPSAAQPPAAPAAAAADSIPDAVPRVERRSRYGNPPFYDVFGRRYYVLSSSSDYIERGIASWYGPGFHKISTSTHEPYDMYGMTAAHRTLPLPAYVRVTNLQNGRSVVVRVNDRGPFVGNRIIDLSYSAAAKLGMLRDGTAMVEVRSIDPAAPAEPLAPMSVPTAPLGTPAPLGTAMPESVFFVQAGAFADLANAERLAARLREGGYGNVFVRGTVIAGRTMYRVRIGPVPDVPQFDRIVGALERAGVRDARLAMD